MSIRDFHELTSIHNSRSSRLQNSPFFLKLPTSELFRASYCIIFGDFALVPLPLYFIASTRNSVPAKINGTTSVNETATILTENHALNQAFINELKNGVKKRGLYRTYWYRPRIIQFLLLFPLQRILFLKSLPKQMQTDIVNIHLARTAGYCHIALGSQANRYGSHVGQIDALIS